MAARRGGGGALAGLLRKRPASRRMSVTERLPLTQSHILHMVRIGDRSLLIATHPQGVAFLPAERGEARFSQVLDEEIAGQVQRPRVAEEES